MIVKVTTQAEMDAALENPNAEVWLIGSGVCWPQNGSSKHIWRGNDRQSYNTG